MRRREFLTANNIVPILIRQQNGRRKRQNNTGEPDGS
jgi:hypothetical protein